VRRSVGAIVVLALAGVTVSGQQPSFHIASRDLVVLPVTVVDRQGAFVADLPREQFTVFDNGRRQPLEFFSNEDTPVTVGIVIDSSSSMRPKMGEVVAATVAFARSSNPDDELFVLEFSDAVHDAVPEHRSLLASDIGALQSAVSAVRPDGRTALYDGVLEGLARLDEGHRPRKALILMSDGGDNASHATLETVLARAHKSNAAIYTIGLFDTDDPDQNPGALQSLSRATGGERFLPSSPGPLLQACQRIARAIRSGYTMAYEPPDRDGTFHRVRVEVSDPERRRLTVRTREGYTAGRPVPTGP
jgi:Ca-activated chloride channel family protein